MKIKMIKNQLVAPTGVKTVLWKTGEVHEVDDKLGKVLVTDIGCAVKASPIAKPEEKAAPKVEVKKEAPMPPNPVPRYPKGKKRK